VIAASTTAVVYGAKSIYDFYNWNYGGQESEFKQQYIDHGAKKLQPIIYLTSANCSQQVQQ
jgi:hypothetical protein